MEKIRVFVGLGCHPDSVQVCVLDWGGKVLGNGTCDNDLRRVAEYVATHGGVRGAAMESCEGAADVERVEYVPYVWWTPWNAWSGSRQADAGLIRACNHDLRSVLIEAGHRLKRCDPRWSALANQRRQTGKPGSVIAAALAHRWMRWLYHETTAAQAA